MSLKRIFGAIVGAAIGFAIGGPIGALQGALQGYTIGTALEDTQLPPGPRLEDIQQNVSTYGNAIPRVYGTEQLTANIVWMKDNQLQERTEEVVVQEGGFLAGDVTQTVYKYSATFAVALCEGVIDQVTRVWANDHLLYEVPSNFEGSEFSLWSTTSDVETTKLLDPERIEVLQQIQALPNVSVSGSEQVRFRLYRGTKDQAADPAMVAALGDDAPAFRGVAYMVVEGLELTNNRFRNAIPQLRFEVVRNSTDTETVEKSFRTFAATYEPADQDGNLEGTSVQVISINARQPGSVLGDTDTITPRAGGGGGRGQLQTYAFSNGFIHHLQGATQAGTDFPGKRVNIQYVLAGGTTITQLNQDLPPYLFQTHDPSNLAGLNFVLDQATYSKQATNLIKEEVAYLFPFDMPDTTEFSVPSTVQPNIFPIQNLPNWVVATRGNRISIGFTRGGRFELWDLGINLEEEKNNGNIDNNYNQVINGFEYHIRAALLGGVVYIYSKFATTAETQWFPGVIRVNIEGLYETVAGSNLVTVLPKNSVLDLGGNSFIQNTTVETYIVNQTSGQVPWGKTLSNNRVIWRRDLALTELGYDYENNKLYSVLRRRWDNNSTFIGNSPGGSWINSSDIINSAVTENVIELNRNSLVTLDTSNFINPSYLNNLVGGEQARLSNTELCVFRVYEGEFADFGYITYRMAPTREQSVFVVPNGTSVLRDIGTWQQDNSVVGGPAEPLNNPVANQQSQYYYLLPDFNVSGTERANVFSACTMEINSELLGIDEIQRQVVILNGNLEDVFGTKPGIQVGELLTAEIARQETVSTTDDIDFSPLQETIRGLAIKDRGPLTSTAKALQDAYIFDIVESDYKLQGELRRDKTVNTSITWEELGASDKPGGDYEFKLTTPARGQLPSQYHITYRNPDLEYNTDTVVWQDPSVTSNITLTTKIPLSLRVDDAYNIARRMALSTISARQGIVEVTTSAKYSDLEIGEFVQLTLSDSKVYTIRIIAIDKGRPGLVKLKGVVDNPINYTYEKTGLASQVATQSDLRQIASPIVLDALPFKESEDGMGYWVGAYSLNNNNVFTSTTQVKDLAAVDLSKPRVVTNTTAVGYAGDSVLPNATTEGEFDYRNTLTFAPINFAEGFATRTETEVLESELVNTFFYGSNNNWELIKVVNFTDNGDGTVTASGLLRGYKGTSHFSTHAEGSYIVSANPGSLARLTTEVSNQGKTADVFLIDPSPVANSIVRRTLEYGNRLPMPPVNLFGYKKQDGAFYLEWTRQARYGVEWVNDNDIILDEATEQYKVFFLDFSTLEILGERDVFDQTDYELGVADQTIIYGLEQSTVKIVVAQWSQELDTYGHISDVYTI